MIVAAIDVGTNSTRLLVAEVGAKGIPVPLCRKLSTTRLGQGITGGRLLPRAMDRTLAAINEFMALARQAGAGQVVLAATSAVRDAANREDFVRAVYAATGTPLQVLSGRDEARLGYLGVTSGLEGVENAVVVDIGGGSTEFTWRRAGEICCTSVNVGAVRMTECGCGAAQIRASLDAALQAVKRDGFARVVGVGGTVTTLAAMALGLADYDPARVHGFCLDRATVDQMEQMLHRLPLEDRKRLVGLQPERADIIPAGARILKTVLYGLEAESMVVSEADILYGLVIEARSLS